MTNPTPADVERLIAEAEAALEGLPEEKWLVEVEAEPEDEFPVVYVCHERTQCDVSTVCNLLPSIDDDTEDRMARARFIAHARQAVPALIAALRAMQVEMDELRKTLDAHFNQAMANGSEAFAAKAKLAEVEKERDEQVADLNDVIVMNNRTAAQLEATVSTLTAQVEAMRGALKPFIGLAKYRVADDPKWRDHDTVQVVITIGALRAALTTENQNG